MEMIDNDIYSVLQLSTEPPAQNDYRPQQKVSSSRSPLSRHVAIALGLLNTLLVCLLLVQWILCQGSTRASCPSCPDFWVRYGDHCYYFSVEKNDWNSSLEFCLAEDSHLLMLTGKQEMVPAGEGRMPLTDLIAIADMKFQEILYHKSLLQPFLKEDFYWIGLRNSSGWRWEDGSALNFSRIISNSLIQKCGTFSKNGFQGSSCEVLLQWVCKKVRL